MFPRPFFRMRYQMMISLRPCFSTEILRNPLIKGGLYPTSSYSVLWMRSHGVRYFLGAFRYQTVISLSGCFSAEILQNLLIKGGLYPTSSYDVLRMRFQGVISLAGVCTSTTCPWGHFSILCRTGQRFLLVFLEPLMRCNILRSKCLQPRHLTACRGLGVTE